MKILIGHNHYQQPGGEDAVAKAEVEMLRDHGHDVLFLEFENSGFKALSITSKVHNVLSWGWSQQAYEIVRAHCESFKPEIAHFHNTFYMMTPSVYSACKAAGVPVIQTLHNYRLLCPNGLFYRQGHVCEECMDHSLKSAIKYGCYRNSRVLSWAVVNMLEKHRKEGTWHNKIDLFIAINEFARAKFIEGGLPGEKIFVKPNSIAFDPGLREATGDYFVFAGRLSEEKGIKLLLDTFRSLPEEKLIVMGDGPLMDDCKEHTKKNGMQNIQMMGHLNKREYYSILKKAKALIVPSLSYEQYTLVAVEAFACGVPVIASRLGSMKELVDDGRTGLLFEPGDLKDLAQKITLLNNDISGALAWGKEARRVFEAKFSTGSNYERLITLYQQVKIT